MSNQANSLSKGLTVKDLVTTGIFTTLVFVFVLIGGIFFAPNPVLTFFMPAGSGLLAGPVFLLMIAKVQKRWSLSIMGVVICIIWFVTGHEGRERDYDYCPDADQEKADAGSLGQGRASGSE